MRKFFVLAGVAMAVAAALAMASPALADDFECDSATAITGRILDDVTVPRGGVCTLIDSTVAGDVDVLRGGYFESGNTAIGGNVEGRKAQTVFIDTGSRVFGHVHGHGTNEVDIFNSTIIRSIFVEDASQVVNVCGNNVFRGDIGVEDSDHDILIGSSDPATECAGNVVSRGDVEVQDNTTDVELTIESNKINRGDLEVRRNKGDSPKFVRDNVGGDDLRCKSNSEPFTVSGNTGWDSITGQCA
jgi:hypothetical protein